MMMRIVLACSIIGMAHSMGFFMREKDCEGTAKCEEGFKLFKRKDGRSWCVKMVIGNVTWWDAEKQCRCEYNATLSGIESVDESRWVEEEAATKYADAGISNGAIWVGSYRRPVCEGPQSGWDAKLCTDEKIFQFTDRNTCGTFLYQNWAAGSPANTVSNGTSVENCGQILFSTDESGSNSELSSQFNNKDCLQITSPKGDIYSSRAYICGKDAEIEKNGYDSYSGGSGFLIGAGKPKRESQ